MTIEIDRSVCSGAVSGTCGAGSAGWIRHEDCSLPITAIHSLLLWHDKQRSEYFADYLAATIAGTALVT